MRQIFSQDELLDTGKKVEAVKKMAPDSTAPVRTRTAR
jgi:hypothetical protein